MCKVLFVTRLKLILNVAITQHHLEKKLTGKPKLSPVLIFIHFDTLSTTVEIRNYTRKSIIQDIDPVNYSELLIHLSLFVQSRSLLCPCIRIS